MTGSTYCSSPRSPSRICPTACRSCWRPTVRLFARSSTIRIVPVFTVEVRDHIMVARSFQGAVFGPAQELHGATFVVDAAFMADELDENGIVIDIGRAHEALKATLSPLNY